MSYFPAYTYSASAGWTFAAQPSSSPDVVNEWSHLDPSNPFPAHYSHFFVSEYYHEIPISKYSSLAGALGPVDTESQPPPVAPANLGVQAKSVAPPPTATTHRRAYVFARAPRRRPRQPAGTPLYCRVEGCQQWTKERGKKMARHRASHFQGKVGVMCPSCGEVFSRSVLCGNHLRVCDPQCWADRAATKGTQDSWGIRVGQELIDMSITNNVDYNPHPECELP